MLIRLLGVTLALALLFATPLRTEEQKARRLESLTWNPTSNKITWEVSTGSPNTKGEYVADGTPRQKYEIDLKEVTMEFGGSKRRFAKEEADNVLMVMQLISRYAQESTIWWEEGKGKPVDKKEKVMLEPAHPLTHETLAQLIRSSH